MLWLAFFVVVVVVGAVGVVVNINRWRLDKSIRVERCGVSRAPELAFADGWPATPRCQGCCRTADLTCAV